MFLRAWVPVSPKKFYFPVTSLLLKDKAAPWVGMRTVGEIRRDRKERAPVKKDSKYEVLDTNH